MGRGGVGWIRLQGFAILGKGHLVMAPGLGDAAETIKRLRMPRRQLGGPEIGPLRRIPLSPVFQCSPLVQSLFGHGQLFHIHGGKGRLPAPGWKGRFLPGRTSSGDPPHHHDRQGNPSKKAKA